MKAIVVSCLAFALVSCGKWRDPSVSAETFALMEPLGESVDITRDCYGSGTVRVVASVTTHEEPDPLMLDLDVAYTYTACESKKQGTVAGTLVYSRLTEETTTDGLYVTSITYAGNLTYSGDTSGVCTVNVTSTATSDDLKAKYRMTEACPHPEAKDLSRLEKKCKLDGKGKGKKKKKHKCELHGL